MAKIQTPENKETPKVLPNNKIGVLKKILGDMEKENISYISDTANDWFYNEVMNLKPQEQLILQDEISLESDFIQFFRKNFYWFEYKPMEQYPRNKGINEYAYDSYDRRPFILLLKRKKNILHGLNLNYLYRREKNLLINFLFRYLKGDILDTREEISKIMLEYKNMKQKDWVHWHKLIYRKYHVSRINEPRVIPIKYVKLFSFLESSRFRASLNKIYKTSFRKMRKERMEQHQGKGS